MSDAGSAGMDAASTQVSAVRDGAPVPMMVRRLAADFARAHPDAVVVRTTTRSVIATPTAASRAGIPADEQRLPARTRTAGIRRAAARVLADIHRSCTPVAEDTPAVADPPSGGHALATIQDETTIATKYALARILRDLHDLRLPVIVAPSPDALVALKRTGLDWLAEGLHIVPHLSVAEFQQLASTAVVLASDSGDPEVDVERASLLAPRAGSDSLDRRAA
jgi:hypothetical protein